MAMTVGQAHSDPVTGMAGRIYTALTGAGDSGLAAAATTPGSSARNALASMCEAIAAAVIAEIQASATVVIKSAAGYDGLQRDQTDGIATIRPVADVTLPGGTIQ